MAHSEGKNESEAMMAKSVSQPLVTHIYTADPSAHVFNGRIYISIARHRDIHT
jgi:hypothetical protein